MHFQIHCECEAAAPSVYNSMDVLTSLTEMCQVVHPLTAFFNLAVKLMCCIPFRCINGDTALFLCWLSELSPTSCLCSQRRPNWVSSCHMGHFFLLKTKTYMKFIKTTCVELKNSSIKWTLPGLFQQNVSRVNCQQGSLFSICSMLQNILLHLLCNI